MRSAMNRFILIISFVFFLLAGCSEDSTEPSDHGVLVPMKVGNIWIYQTTDYDENGDISYVSLDTFSITKKYTVDSDDVYLRRAIYHIGDEYIDEVFGYYSNKSDGFHFHGFIFDDQPPGKQSLLINKYPTEEGDKFNTMDYEFLVEKTDENIKIPAGEFSCYKYIKLVDGNTGIEYCKPGLGLVKAENYSEGELSKKMELISYQLN